MPNTSCKFALHRQLCELLRFSRWLKFLQLICLFPGFSALESTVPERNSHPIMFFREKKSWHECRGASYCFSVCAKWQHVFHAIMEQRNTQNPGICDSQIPGKIKNFTSIPPASNTHLNPLTTWLEFDRPTRHSNSLSLPTYPEHMTRFKSIRNR